MFPIANLIILFLLCKKKSEGENEIICQVHNHPLITYIKLILYHYSYEEIDLLWKSRFINTPTNIDNEENKSNVFASHTQYNGLNDSSAPPSYILNKQYPEIIE